MQNYTVTDLVSPAKEAPFLNSIIQCQKGYKLKLSLGDNLAKLSRSLIPVT